MYVYIVFRRQPDRFNEDEFTFEVCGVFDNMEKANQCREEWGEYITYTEDWGLNIIYD